MISTVSARRYAQAVFQIAESQNKLDEWKVQLDNITDLMKDQQVCEIIENPKVPFNLKADLFKHKLANADQLILNLCCLLIAKGKIRNADQIADEYSQLLDDLRGIKHAVVTTAVKLEESDKQKISVQLEKITGTKVEVKLQVNPAILGGLVARIEDTLIDGSVYNRLQLLKKELTEASK